MHKIKLHANTVKMNGTPSRNKTFQTVVHFDPPDPELDVIVATGDDDPSPSNASVPIRPCWCKLRMESAMMRAVFFWYPPDVTMRMGMANCRAALKTISSLFTMP